MLGPIPVDDLDRVIEDAILGHPLKQGRRLLGLEYERLILHRESRASAPLDFCRDLLERLMREFDADPMREGEVLKGVRAQGFDLSLEPGGQFEIAAPPHENLAAVDRTVERVTAVVDRLLRDSDYELVCLGHAPVTPVAEIGLLPRARYRLMDARMPARGALTRNMMRATAGFQLTYDVLDAEDAGRKLALLNRLSPVLMAITANSRRVEGRDSGFASFRHLVWWDTDRDRSGIPEGCLQAETAVRGYVRYARRARMLFLERDGVLVPAPEEPLERLAAQRQITRADVDLHLSSLFPFVRLRNYIEIRCFDSVPWPLARSVLALVSGLVYCPRATAAAWGLSEHLVVDGPEALRDLHLEAARHGLDTVTPRGVRFCDLAGQLIEFSAATLGGADCDWAAVGDLDVVRERVHDPCPPARI